MGEEFNEDDEEAWFAGKSAADIELTNLQKKAKGEPQHDRDPTLADKAKDKVRNRKREIPRLREEELVQEVLKRVKGRIAKLAKK